MSELCMDTLIMGGVRLVMHEELNVPFATPAPHKELERLADKALIDHVAWYDRIRHGQMGERDGIGNWCNYVIADINELFGRSLETVRGGRINASDMVTFRGLCQCLQRRLDLIPEFKVFDCLEENEKKIIQEDLEVNFKNYGLPVTHVYYIHGEVAGYITITSSYYGKTLMYTSKTKVDKVTEHYILQYINGVAKETKNTLEKL